MRSLPLLDAIARGARGALVADGGLGTSLHERGFPFEVCYEELVLSRPDVIAAVHEDFVRAGARLIETNTFGANRIRLVHHGLGDRAHEINLAAARLARRAAGSRAWVAGSIGPLGPGLPPEDAREAFREQAAALAEGGVDAIVIETMRHPDEIALAIEGVKLAPSRDLPLIAEVSLGPDLTMADGTPLAVVAERLRALGCDAIGVNCCDGPDTVLAAVKELLPIGLPISAMPSAGLPRRMEDRFVYPSTPEHFGTVARQLFAMGVAIVGGCCGTTPAHIAAASAALADPLAAAS